MAAVPHNLWKIPAARDIIARAQLVGKRSTPYAPDTPHDFMHNKVLVIDDTVITGSYNFSRSAEANAENILTIESAPLAEAYSAYIAKLMETIGRRATLLIPRDLRRDGQPAPVTPRPDIGVAAGAGATVAQGVGRARVDDGEVAQ